MARLTKSQQLNTCCKLGKEIGGDMDKGAFFRFVKGRFTAGYILIYLFCVLCAVNTVGTLLNLLAYNDSAELCGWLFGRPSYGPSEGFGRRWFWMMASGVPLAVYVPFARTLSYGRSMLALLACACLSAAPVLVYALVVRPNEGYPMPAAWQNYTLAILSYVCYFHIAIDLTDRRMTGGSMREKIASTLLRYAFIIFVGNLVRALLTVHGDLYLDNPLFWVLFVLGAIVAAAIARHDYLKEHGGYPR